MSRQRASARTLLDPVLRRSSTFPLLLVACLACSDGTSGGGPTVDRPRFDGGAALELVRTQVDFGPRVPGTAGHAAQLAWMVARLDSLGGAVAVDTFSHTTQAGEQLTLYNVEARFRPEASRRILLLAHWDTRPTADQAADSALRGTPIAGANDGGSGTAVLLQLAALFAESPPPMGIDLLFTDGEDYGPGLDDMLLGARRYASRLGEGARPVYAVLLDMVGDHDPSFPVEDLSAQFAGPVVRKVWDAAERLGYSARFPRGVGQRLVDDHLPLIEAGLPTANVIDFEYGPGNRYWHTPEDLPAQVSPQTLEMVGEVIAELVYSGG